MAYVRGHALDYDRWQAEGAAGWSYEDCLPYFRRAQQHSLGEDQYRGGSGPLRVSRTPLHSPLHQAWLQAGQQAGYPLTQDMNGFQQAGNLIHILFDQKNSSQSQVLANNSHFCLYAGGSRGDGCEYLGRGEMERRHSLPPPCPHPPKPHHRHRRPRHQGTPDHK